MTMYFLFLADGVWRGSKIIGLKEITDDAIALASSKGLTVKNCIVVKHLTGDDAIGTFDHKTDLSKFVAKRPCPVFKVL